mmetsp:Transcript_91716/g.222777  ORF Transcript_91716/g.222777 Transcript_91716/m.222777 type:complete len:298 (+) Transcript_91716:790-1683(+)
MLQHMAKLLPEPSLKQPPGSWSTKPSSRRTWAWTSPRTPRQSSVCCCRTPPTCSAADLRKASRCSDALEFTCSSCSRSTSPAALNAQSGPSFARCRQCCPSAGKWCVRRRANFATGSEASSSSSSRPPDSSARTRRSTSSCFSTAGSSSSLVPPPSSSKRLRAFCSLATDQLRNSSSLSTRRGLPGCASSDGSPNQTSSAPPTLRCQYGILEHSRTRRGGTSQASPRMPVRGCRCGSDLRGKPLHSPSRQGLRGKGICTDTSLPAATCCTAKAACSSAASVRRSTPSGPTAAFWKGW